MTYTRRDGIRAVLTLAALATVPGARAAEHYASRLVRIIVGFPPGNAPDLVARLTADRLSQRLGQAVIVENRVGAASTIAANTVASAAPDGYTLLQITPANAINPSLRNGLEFTRDITPVASVATGPLIVVVDAASPIHSVAEFVQLARTSPDKVTIASTGAGSTPYLSAALFKMMTGVESTLVPFGGSSQAATELLGGRATAAFVDMSVNPLVQARSLRALAVTTAKEQALLPGVPTVGQAVPGYEASTWYGIGAPREVPLEIIERLNEEINAGLENDEIRARLATLGVTLDLGTSADFGRKIVAETEKWAKVSKIAMPQQ